MARDGYHPQRPSDLTTGGASIENGKKSKNNYLETLWRKHWASTLDSVFRLEGRLVLTTESMPKK